MARILKTARQMERHLKGISNHYRIEILFLIDEEPGIAVEGIAERLNANYKTVSQHTVSLVRAGLVQKSHEGQLAHNTLTPYGSACVRFLKEFRAM